MNCTILKTFPYAADGMTIRNLEPNTVVEIRDDLVAGLKDAGLIATDDGDDDKADSPPDTKVIKSAPETQATTAPETQATTAPKQSVEIPDDWRELQWPALRSLASQVSDAPINGKGEAIKAIEAEVAAREAKAAS